MSAPTPRTAEPGTAVRPPGDSRLPGGSGRADRAAALGVLVVLLHLVLAQATLIAAAAAVVTSRITRWRPLWLAAPAGAGTAWTAGIGVRRALTGFLAGPRQVLGDLAGSAGHPGRLAPLTAFSVAVHSLPEQLPIALILAAGEATAVGWLARRDWLGGPDGVPDYRPGLIVALRRRQTVAALAAGEVVTRAGCALGLDPASGRPAEVTWAQAEGGVLITGAGDLTAVLGGLPLACAAVRRRKTVIVIDLAGRAGLAAALSGACEAAGVPLTRIEPDQPELAGRLGQAVRERAAVLLAAGREGYRPAAGAGARLALAGLAGLLHDLDEQRLRGDCLAWIHGITAADEPGLAGLPPLGTVTGTAVLLSTGDEAAAAALASAVRVVVAAGAVGQGLETVLQSRLQLHIDSSPGAVAGALAWQDQGEFTIFERGPGPGPRVRPGGQVIPGPWAGLT